MDYQETYVQFLTKHLQVVRPLKIVVDASNGPAGAIFKNVAAKSGLEVKYLNLEVDPDFSGHGPNPLAEGAAEQCIAEVLKTNADMGVIFDGDGDRAVFVDEKGTVLPSYVVSLMLFQPVDGVYVADELVYMSLKNTGLFTEAQLVPSKVGSYHVKQVMQEVDAVNAAELSGHYYFKDFFGVDSGIFTAIKICNYVSQLKTSLSAYVRQNAKEVIYTTNVHLENETWEEVLQKVMSQYKDKGELVYRDGVTIDMDEVWINLRPSNTEPLIRITGGSVNEDLLQGEVAKLPWQTS